MNSTHLCLQCNKDIGTTNSDFCSMNCQMMYETMQDREKLINENSRLSEKLYLLELGLENMRNFLGINALADKCALDLNKQEVEA